MLCSITYILLQDYSCVHHTLHTFLLQWQIHGAGCSENVVNIKYY